MLSTQIKRMPHWHSNHGQSVKNTEKQIDKYCDQTASGKSSHTAFGKLLFWTWDLKKEEEEERDIQAFENKWIRKLLRIAWIRKTANIEVWSTEGMATAIGNYWTIL